MKKILPLLIVVMFCFSGCASVNYSYTETDTSLKQAVYVELDEATLSEAGCTLETAKEHIESCIEIVYTNAYNEFMDSLQSMMATSTINSAQCQAIVDSVKIVSKWHTDTTYEYSMTFCNMYEPDSQTYLDYEEIYYFFNYGTFTAPESDDEDEDTNILTEDYLTSTLSNTHKTAFANIETFETFFLNKFGEYGFTIDDVEYSYSHGTPYRRLHSDADIIQNVDGIYTHTWFLASGDDEITLYRVFANTENWYYVALIIGASAVIIISIISVFVKKRAKKALSVKIDTTF